MRANVVVTLALVLLGLGGVVGMAAAAEEAETTAAPASASAVSTEDKTGTNPANLQNTLVLSNEFIELPGGGYTNKASFKYTMPLNPQRTMSLMLGVPFVTTDLGGETDFGFGDLQLKWLWITKLTPKYAWAVAIDSNWNTATKDTLGTGKHWLAPQVFYAMFLKGAIFAPAVLQKFDIGGDDDRADINQTILDFYYVRPFAPGQWVVIDPQVVFDHEADTTAGQVKITYGRMISGGMSFFITPAIPVGADAFIDWSVEVGVKNVF